MMATTHVLAGVVLAAAVGLFAPDAGPVPVLAAALGGLFPDFDLYAGHRKTLHFPVYYPLAAGALTAGALVEPSTLLVSAALFFAAAALHSVMDVVGGGLELRPWLGTSDRAVYSHYHRRWLAPRRWIRYDGAPEDLALAGLFATPAILAFEGSLEAVVIAALGVSVVYAALRKPLVSVAEYLVRTLPAHLLAHVPKRFVDVDELR